MDVMLDLETLSTRPNAVILSMGAVKFDPFSLRIDVDEGINVRVDVDEQTALGRHVQQETIDWWATQPQEVQEEAFAEHQRISLTELVKLLNKFLVGADNIWCQGPVFDIAILEDLYRQLGIPTPWQYWQIRDSRTLFGVHGDPRDRNRHGAHNALLDCCYQAMGVQEIYQQQGVKPRFEK
jgi:exodeoxyribonuclease VIII